MRDYMTAAIAESSCDERDEDTDGDEVELERDARSAALHIRWGLVIQLMIVPPIPIPWIFAVPYFRLVPWIRSEPSGHSFTRAVLLFSAALAAIPSIWSVLWIVSVFFPTEPPQ